ncbi:MAG TPA: hypothetical protein VIY69_11965, partial [Candidatus Acidoferrales bacterium]
MPWVTGDAALRSPTASMEIVSPRLNAELRSKDHSALLKHVALGARPFLYGRQDAAVDGSALLALSANKLRTASSTACPP